MGIVKLQKLLIENCYKKIKFQFLLTIFKKSVKDYAVSELKLYYEENILSTKISTFHQQFLVPSS